MKKSQITCNLTLSEMTVMHECLMICTKSNRKTKPGEVNLTRLSDMFNKQLRNALRTPIESSSVRDSIIVRYGRTLLSYLQRSRCSLSFIFLSFLSTHPSIYYIRTTHSLYMIQPHIIMQKL